MASGTRSKRGCWTCRIRKKKCDENIPQCNACLSLSIYCYAFNQKPEWVDGGEGEREGVTRIKNAVKETMSRRAALHASLRRQNRRKTRGEEREESQVSPLAEHVSPSLLVSDHGDSDGQMPGLTPDISSHSDKSPNTITTTPPSASNQLRRNGISIPGSSAIHDLATLTLPPFSGYEYEEVADDEDGRSTPPRVLADHRERLLMHFLDHVFPIEFPFYNPSVSNGGRGWLLSLLIRTSPLYHAALSVSAYHHSALNVVQNLRCKIQTWEELQKHHTLALKELHQIMPELVVGGRAQEDLNCRINALASIVQMIAFELFVGGAEIWKTHLQAAIALFTAFLGPPATCKTTWEAITNPRDRQGREVYSANTCAAIFLSAVLIWFDILACVSTGLRPLLHEYHEPLLTGQEPLIRLDEVMGCRSEVMILISHIAELEAWKRECRDGGKLNNMKLVMRATSIAEKLEAARQILNEEVQQSMRAEKEVSRLFATAALVYLHVVVSGFQYSLPEIRENVATAMTMFRELSNERLLRSLVWPLCVTGCMATNEQEEWFKELVMGMSAEVYMFGGARNALRIMEKCWQKRDQRDEEWDWERCMNSLGCLVLIV